MAQTTTSLGGVNTIVRVSADGTTWVDISGSTNQIAATEQARASGEAYTFDGDVAIVTPGKREPTEITLRTLYTITATEAWFKARGYFETVGGAPTWLEWAPGASLTGRTYRCEAAHITRFQYPAVDAADANPIACEVSFRCEKITECHGGVPIAEYEDLVELYTETDGAAWNDKTNWLSDAALVEDWFGITTANGHVITIALNNNLLNGDVPTTWPDNLPRLRTLNVSDNGLSTVEVDSFLTGVYTNRMRFNNSPLLLAVGGTNDAPNGLLDAPPPLDAGAMGYELVNDSLGNGHAKWASVTI